MQPVTFTPWASASRTPCAPGNDGSSAGWVFTQRPPKESRNGGPTSFMNPARTTRSGACAAHARASAASQSCAGGVVGQADGEGGDAGPLGPGQRVDPAAVRADRDHPGPVARVARRRRSAPAGWSPRRRRAPPAARSRSHLKARDRVAQRTGQNRPDGQIPATGRARNPAAWDAAGPPVATAGPGLAPAGPGGVRAGRAQPARLGPRAGQRAPRRVRGRLDPAVRRDGDLARRHASTAGRGAVARPGRAGRPAGSCSAGSASTFSTLWLLVLAVFWPQLNTYYNCMSGANTVAAQQVCRTQLTNSIGDELSILQDGR